MSMQVCERAIRLGVETVTQRRKRQQGRTRERLMADILESHAARRFDDGPAPWRICSFDLERWNLSSYRLLSPQRSPITPGVSSCDRPDPGRYAPFHFPLTGLRFEQT